MSEADRRHVMRHMDTSQRCEPPANPAKVIATSTTSEADEALRKRKAKNMQRNSDKSIGGFAGLLKELNNAAAEEAVEKALKSTNGAGTVTNLKMNHGLDQHAVMKALHDGTTVYGAAVKPAETTMIKSLTPVFDKAAKGLGVGNPLLKSDAPTGSSSLEATYNSDSATLTSGDALRKQSLPKKFFVEMQLASLTGDQITKAASAALNAGAITGAEANTIATHVALNGGKHCDLDLLKKLKDHVK